MIAKADAARAGRPSSDGTSSDGTSSDGASSRGPSSRELLGLAAAIISLAVATRIPLIAESFWVDELHSAWAVSGTFDEVRQRAALGNQTPLYYWGLWCWRQGVGESELALRMSSVLVSAFACAIVAVGVAKRGGGMLGGAAAGAFLAIESNAIFFGTELRVFATVMLLAAIVGWAWSEFRSGNAAVAGPVMIGAILLAALIQPMSLGVLVWPAIWEGARKVFMRRQDRRWRLTRKTLCAFTATLLLGWLAWDLAGRVWWVAWQHRDQWQAVGAARSGQQLLRIWPWSWLLVVPVVAAWAVERCQSWRRMPTAQMTAESGWGGGIRLWGPPAAVAVGATLFYWAIAASGVAAIFHRRYLIAALPLLAWAGGAAVGQAGDSLARLYRASCRGGSCPGGGGLNGSGLGAAERRCSAALLAGLWLWVLIAAWPALRHGVSPAMRFRGEDWRGAAEYLREGAGDDTVIWLSPGLIETERCLASGKPEDQDYLVYPLRGPYRLGGVTAISLRPARLAEPLRRRLTAGEPWYAVIRGPRGLAEKWGGSLVDLAKPVRLGVESAEFGGVQVLRFTPR